MFCDRGDESILHLFRDCSRASQVWVSLANHRVPSNFFVGNLNMWLIENLKSDKVINDLEWKTIFAIGLLYLWRSRNLMVFQGERESAFEVGKRVVYQAEAVQHCYKSCLVKSNFPHPIGNPVSWIAPVGDSFKLNCDGAVARFGEAAAAGGILRNQWGEFVCGFASHLGQCSALEAELKAIHMGALLVKRRGFDSVEIESDSMQVIKLIKE